MKTTAVYPGSFDPITNGHVDIVRRSLQVFDRVIVAVAFNANKDTAWFTPDERVAMIQETFRAEGDRIVADAFSGLLVDYAATKGANVIVRGLRAVADFEYEFQMTMMNRHLRPQVETIFMMTGESHFYTSSRLVKEVASLGGNVAGLLPDHVVPLLQARARKARP
jgi:pantetheine-phosphate adenylyltransferase